MASKAPDGRNPRARSRSAKRAGDEQPPEPAHEPAAPEPRGTSSDEDFDDSPTTPSPQTLGDYMVIARLGGGGMADVFLAHKMSRFGFVRRAVIKRVKRSRPGYKNLQRMLLDEARATACFDHPNIVGILDVGEDDNGVYLALEYVDGTDLRWVNTKLRTRKEALPFELACYITIEVLRGLHHAHTVQGPDGEPLEIVHRDVNPSNVLISMSGHVKLADFGVVRMRDRVQQNTEAGLVKGKYAYLAPEYIAGEQCTLLSDIYAAGIMLFELLSGRECFTGNTTYEVMWKIVNRGVPMYRLEREGVPEDLCRIIQRATNPVPERRFGSAQEMANALETWLMKNQKHATAWVLSVFFHRHQLFPSREERAAQNVVPAIARSVHAAQERGEPSSQWNEPTPYLPGSSPLRRDVAPDATPPPELEPPPAPSPYSGRFGDPNELGGYDPSAVEARRRAPTEPPPRSGTPFAPQPTPSAPAAALSLPPIDVQRAMAEGVHLQFPTEPKRSRESAEANLAQRVREAAERATIPAISWPEEARARRDEWAGADRATPMPAIVATSEPDPIAPSFDAVSQPGRTSVDIPFDAPVLHDPAEEPTDELPDADDEQITADADPGDEVLTADAAPTIAMSAVDLSRSQPSLQSPASSPTAAAPLSPITPASLKPPSSVASTLTPPSVANAREPGVTPTAARPLSPISLPSASPLVAQNVPAPAATPSATPVGGSLRPMSMAQAQAALAEPAGRRGDDGAPEPKTDAAVLPARPPVSTSSPSTSRPSFAEAAAAIASSVAASLGLAAPSRGKTPAAVDATAPSRSRAPSTSTPATAPAERTAVDLPRPDLDLAVPPPAQSPRSEAPVEPPTEPMVRKTPGSLPPLTGNVTPAAGYIPRDLWATPPGEAAGAVTVSHADVEIETPDDESARTMAGPRPTFDEEPSEPEVAEAHVGDEPWSGKLEEISAAEALDQLSRAAASGTLEFRCGLIWKRLQLDQGMPIAITSNMGMELIGEHLVKARLLSRRELDRALHAAERDGQPLTSKLLDLNMIERARLEDELGKNLTARLAEVLDWRWGTFDFLPQPSESTAIKPKLDLHGIIQSAIEARAKSDAEEAPGQEAKTENEQSRLKEAFKRARSIAQSTGKGRVDDVGSGPRPSTKR